MSMTGQKMREVLCGKSENFSLLLRDVRDLVGEPSEVRMLTGIQGSRDDRQVVLMLIPTNCGAIEVFCPIELIDGQETVVGGWVGSELTENDEKPVNRDPQTIRGIDHLKGLFG